MNDDKRIIFDIALLKYCVRKDGRIFNIKRWTELKPDKLITVYLGFGKQKRIQTNELIRYATNGGVI